ncbi:N-acetylmuramoyl-L-alanine amidase [Telmatospirillum sp.]|uniref:N-acetylmuramoyl-L-alanine amidase n=1 Tax=Telmatospirillum sp. TaxID=2079197 RepID=UPI00284ABE25|nr:N-acetylmuramoyl-L-alanine amidase [Telmatospirillum sp.]MDR3439025.1 N-acetylmuramoyl-L-alanine amidase [Telmatospirillum sp.]
MGHLRGLLLRILITVLLLPVGDAVAAAERPAVTAVRVADHDGVTRFVMDLSSSVRFQVVGQSDPSRVVVEFPGLGWASSAKGLQRPVGVLHNFHFEGQGAGSDRLVLEAGRAVSVQKAFLIPPTAGSSFRLVVDLVPGAAAPVPPVSGSKGPANSGNPILSQAPASAPPTAPTPPIAPPPAAAGAGRHVEGDKVASGAVPPRPAPPRPTPPGQAAATQVMAPDLSARPSDRKAAHTGKPIVVIDPGHGGVDPGATSLSGAYEKNIVLALARDVKTQLDKDGKVKCLLTRDRDVFIPLRERVSIARTANADLFVSLHADTVADPDIRGLSVYTLSQTASDAESQALADKENKADIVAGIDLSNESPEVTNILIDLVQRESMNLSAVFAHQLIREVSHETRQLLQNTHRFAGFAVLKAPDVPSVLVEAGYLSNSADEQMLRRPEYRAKLAGAVARSIEHYFAQTRKARRS